MREEKTEKPSFLKREARNEHDELSGGSFEMKFPDETAHLAEITGKISVELKEAERAVDLMDKEYREAVMYRAEQRGNIDPKEMFQSEMMLYEIDSSGVSAVERRERMQKTMDSPYFARIDFKPQNAEEAAYYIGRFPFYSESKLLIIDWRSPVAGMFYDYETGPAEYTAPGGSIAGELTRKRQFKIKNSKMEFAFESSENIQDDVLQQELAATSDEKMKTIISTIQKEQNKIIRNGTAHTLIIQGVAGSGKTSIALHRVAFLMYRLKDRLKAQNVTIISPNKVFGDYISGVLPELGEDPVFETSFAEIAKLQIEPEIDFEADKNPLETTDKAWLERTKFKSSLEFVTLMDEYIARVPETAFEAQDYTFEEYTIPAEWITARVEVYARFPLVKRLEMIADDIHSRLENQNFYDVKLPTLRNIFLALKRMLKFRTTLLLYKNFFREIGNTRMLKLPVKNTLEWNDVYPFLYLQSAFTGLQESRLIKHLVIDEMQDYTPIQYAVTKRLFSCPKTILGDFGQSVNPSVDYNLADLNAMFAAAELFRMEKSYRSTYEIIQFAKKIAGNQGFEAVERHGETPSIKACAGKEEEIREIVKLIEKYQLSGYNTMGIITKTTADAEALHSALKELTTAEIGIIMPDSESFKSGISVMSIQMSKGLEFDEVVIPFAGKETYNSSFERNLLYVACTRAMHKLSVLYSGGKSGLLP